MKTLEIKKDKKIKAKIFLFSFIGLCLIGLILLAFCRQIFGNQVGDQILGEGVQNGFIILGEFFIEKGSSLISSFLSICLCLIIYFALVLIITLTLKKNAKQKTIASLLKSLCKYLVVVLGICMVLGSWGVDVGSIFAGVGILTLVIGLGCKTLVNDIVSGFFIVVDNYYEVGDRVIIDGFTGDIDSVGLRTTKIISWDGNIKCINNSLITTVVNLSKQDSYAVVSIELSFKEDLRRAEAVIAKNIAKIKENLPAIIEGPNYCGVDEITNCGISLKFNAKCNEFDRVPLQRALLRELFLLFEDNDLIVPYQQIVVNQPDPDNRPRATEEDLKLSYELRNPKKK